MAVTFTTYKISKRHGGYQIAAREVYDGLERQEDDNIPCRVLINENYIELNDIVW